MSTISPPRLTEEQRRRLEARLAEVSPTIIPPRPPGPTPLSSWQERIWLYEQMDPGGAAHHVRWGLRVRGAIDQPALQQALDALLVRHESLRIRLVTVAGKPLQLVDPPSPVAVVPIDLRAERDPRQALDEVVEAEGRVPFVLEAGGLLRVRHLRLPDDEEMLLLVMHQLVVDGWALDILFSELGALYTAARAGRPAPAWPLPTSYLDFASWQRARADAATRGQPESARASLAGVPPLHLPTDAPGDTQHRVARCTQEIPAELWRATRGLADDVDGTPFMVTLAALAVVLGRRAGQDDFAVGCPVSVRSHAAIENVVGFFANIAVVRLRLDAAPTFRQLVERVRGATLDAFDRQELPFQQLVEALGADRQAGTNPLFNVLMGYVHEPSQPSLGWPVTLEPYPAPQSDVLLAGSVMVGERGARLELVYRADRYAPESPAELLAQVLHVLDQGCAAPEQPIAALSLVTPAARSILPDDTLPLTGQWPGEPVTAAFTRHARATPARPALACGGRTLDYGEAHVRVERLAQRLVADGVAPGDVIAVLGKPGFGLTLTMLAVWRAGGVVLPLDARLPSERKRTMSVTAGCRRAVVVGAADSEDRAWLAPLRLCIVTVDADEPSNVTAPLPTLGADALAYVFFTSGTESTPRAVLGTHGPISRFVAWQIAEFAIGPGDRSAQLTGLSFEPVLRDILTPLSAGATLVIPDDELTDPLAWMEREHITLVHTVPSQLMAWVTASRDASPDGVALCRLRWLFTAGEALTDSMVLRFRGAFPQAGRLVVLYGQTETPQARLFHRVQEPPSPGAQPIGRPLPGTQGLVLSTTGNLCGIGEPGELYIRSVDRARGYLASEANGERWVPHPRSDEALVRTGDRALFRTDGSIALLGRLDEEVKIRGVRVNPSEVAAQLARHLQVSAAHVAAIAGSEVPERQLVAWYVPVAGSAPTERELRRFLGACLPWWMLPARLVPVERLELTSNGKLNVAGLRARPPVPETRRAATPTQERLAALFAQLLGTDVGLDRSFFAAGGHSLLATRLVARIRDTFAVELPVRLVFEAPTVRELAEEIEAHHAPVAATRLTRQDDGLPAPASSTQKRLWLLDQMRGTDGACPYNEAVALELSGALDEPALRRSLDALVARHEAWRSRLPSRDGRLFQEAGSAKAVPLHKVLSNVPVAERSAAVRALAWSEARRPFDLEEGPLLRLFLVEHAVDHHVLLFSLHHIAMDGWSMAVAVRDLDTLYRAELGEAVPPLPELPIRYLDYARWEQRRVANSDRDVAFWSSALRHAPTRLDLPAVRARPALPSHGGARRGFTLGPALVEALDRLALNENASRAMVLLTAWAVTLSGMAGTTDIVIGLAVSGRTHTELEEIVGPFVRTLPLRINYSDQPSFRRLVARVRQSWWDALEHQDLPLERIVTAADVDRHATRTPLFQVLFACQSGPVAPAQVGPLAARLYAIDNGLARFDLTLSVADRPDGCDGLLEWATDLFDEATAARFVSSLESLLNAVVADPDQGLSRAPMNTAARAAAIDRGRAQRRFDGLLLPARLATQVRARPQATAVADDARSLSFAALDERAARLAARLRQAGAQHGDRIGLYLARSIDAVIAMTAIFKVGAAYVPLDPGDPLDRVSWVLSDVGAKLCVTDGAHRAQLPGRVVVVDGLDDDPLPAAADAVVDGSDLAYVLYTSGSTGRPKGVMVEHQAIARLFDAAQEHYQLGSSDVVAAVHALVFDVSVWETWCALVRGGCLLTVPKEVARTPAELHALLARAGVTLLAQTPSAFRLLLPTLAEQPLLPSLRAIVFAGEALDPSLVAPLWARYSPEQPRLMNMYGITETAVYSTIRRIRPEDPPQWSRSIGRPLADVALYVLDDQLEPVPDGVVGELCLGGAGLARGYVGRTGETAARFCRSPFGPPGERLYRSGDLGRRLPDGQIEYVGRGDQQIKHRGMRIELGEIEAVLSSYPGVAAAVVLLVDDPAPRRRLVAYWSASSTVHPTTAELRDHLRRALPPPMVPTAWVQIEQWPLLVSGKVDRRALPLPTVEAVPSAPSPLSADEQLVAEVWREVLAIDRVDRDQNFFELGGDSLMVMRVRARIAQRTGRQLPVRVFFEQQVLADLAAAVARAALAAPLTSVPATPDETFPLSQNQTWVGPHVAPVTLTIPLAGLLDAEALTRALQSVVARHDVLRSYYVATDCILRMKIAAQADVAVTMHTLVALPVEERDPAALAILQRMRAPFDRSRPPLCRFALLSMDAHKYLFTAALDHLVADGPSLIVLLSELSQLYAGEVAGAPLMLPALPMQYADYTRRQASIDQSDEGVAQHRFWSETLRGATAPALPLDWPRPTTSVASHPAHRVPWQVADELIEPLAALARQERCTVGVLFHAAWMVALAHFGALSDVSIDAVHANRQRPGAESLIGYLARPLVLRASIRDGASFREVLREVRERLYQALDHADVDPSFDPRVRLSYVVGGELTLAGVHAWHWEPPGPLVPDKPQWFDVVLGLFEQPGSPRTISGALRYRTDLFAPSSMVELLRTLERVLVSAAHAPDEPLKPASTVAPHPLQMTESSE